jgi:hypothetical protein
VKSISSFVVRDANTALGGPPLRLVMSMDGNSRIRHCTANWANPTSNGRRKAHLQICRIRVAMELTVLV